MIETGETGTTHAGEDGRARMAVEGEEAAEEEMQAVEVEEWQEEAVVGAEVEEEEWEEEAAEEEGVREEKAKTRQPLFPPSQPAPSPKNLLPAGWG